MFTKLVWLLLFLILESGTLASGFPNTQQIPGTVLSGLNAPDQGRTPIIAYHHGLLFTVPEVPSSQPGSDYQVRTWDLADPTSPIELAQHGQTQMPISAHGYMKSGDYLILGSNSSPDGPWSFRANGPLGTLERTTFPSACPGPRGCVFQPWFVTQTYWSYDENEGNSTLEKPRGNVLSSWDHLGMTGVIGHPFLVGDLLIFASEQSRTGVATYDVSDPTNPVLLDVLTTGGPGGYWPELWGGDGKLYVVFPYRRVGNGIRVVDVTDPTDIRLIADRSLPGTEAMYAQFQDHYAFVGDHKVDMRTFESVLFLDGANAVRPNDGGTGIDTSQFALPLGNLLVTGGSGGDQGMAIWAHQAAPDTAGPTVGYHIPQAGRTGYPVGAPISLLIHETLETPTIINGTTFIVRPIGGSAVSGHLSFSFDDILTFTPDTDLQEDTTYEVVLSGIEDAVGNPMVPYTFNFSTGSTVNGNLPPVPTSFDVSVYPVQPSASVTLNATATDPDLDPVEYRFDFADGRPKTNWSSTGSVTTSYSSPGHYRASVQVRDPSGALASRTTTVTVLVPPVGPAPSNSAPIYCDSTSSELWVVNPDNGTVSNLDAQSLTTNYETTVCEDPRNLTRSSQGDLWITCYDSDKLAVVDSSSGGLIQEIPLSYGSAPFGIASVPGSNDLLVTLEGAGVLVRFDSVTRTETGRVALGPTPRAIAVTPDGDRALVTRFLSPKDQAEVWEVATDTLSLDNTIIIPKFGGDEHRDTTASGRGIANYLSSLVISHDGSTAWLTANKPNRERGVFFYDDLDQDNTVRNIIVKLDLDASEYRRAVDLDNSDSAVGIALSPLNDYLFIGLQGNNQVMVLDALVLDATNGMGSLVGRLGAGSSPQGVCFDSTTNRTFVKNLMSRDVSVIETDDLFRTGDVTVPSTEVSTVANETLSPSILLGKQLFYHGGDSRMSSEGYLSCASCHVDGRHDGRTWDFTGRGEGFRNTTSLQGRGGMNQGNVHWTANFDEIQDFENDIRGAFGGSGFLSDSDFAATEDPLGPVKSGLSTDLDALASYVASLDRSSVPRSPFRNSDGSMTATAVAGRVVFSAEGCGTCHAGENFTDSRQGTNVLLHDVGTLRTTSGQRLSGPLAGIDTPTLIGSWDTAPYFHDGSAVGLSEVLEVAGGEVIQAETGTAFDGAEIRTDAIEPDTDNTVHQNGYVRLNETGARLVLNAVDGGPGGIGALELRYSVGPPDALQVIVNGIEHSLVLDSVGNNPAWRHTNWGRVRIEGISYLAGSTNTIEITTDDSNPRISVDDLTVSTADELAKAQPHRRALSLSPSDRADLVDYLLQLDGSPEVNPSGALFLDGFESGDINHWSNSLP